MKPPKKWEGFPNKSLGILKSTDASLLAVGNHQEASMGAVLDCLVPREKGTKKHIHISLWPIIPRQEGTTLKCTIPNLTSTLMMRM